MDERKLKLREKIIWCKLNDERIVLLICEHRCPKTKMKLCKKYYELIKELELEPKVPESKKKRSKKNEFSDDI